MKDDRYLEIRRGTVKKANEIIQKSRFDLSLQQQKIILYLISQISPYDEDFKEYEFSIVEFCQVCGLVHCGKNHEDMKRAILDIHNKGMWIKRDDGQEITVRWISSARIDHDRGIFWVKLDETLKPYLLKLKENFTVYELLWTLNFRSKYTIRLYEYIKSIHFHELDVYKRRCTVDELKRLLEAETYGQYKDFKKRVLLPAVYEINECSDKNLAFEEVTRGRKVIAVEFTISTKDSIESLRLRNDIEKKLDPDQLTLYDTLKGKGLI